MKKQNTLPGYTYIELILVLGMVIILSGLIGVGYTGNIRNNRFTGGVGKVADDYEVARVLSTNVQSVSEDDLLECVIRDCFWRGVMIESNADGYNTYILYGDDISRFDAPATQRSGFIGKKLIKSQGYEALGIKVDRVDHIVAGVPIPQADLGFATAFLAPDAATYTQADPPSIPSIPGAPGFDANQLDVFVMHFSSIGGSTLRGTVTVNPVSGTIDVSFF